MNIFKKIEGAIQDFETTLGVSVTIIDNNGVLHTEDGHPLFSRSRQSHRKNAVCAHGFDVRCIAHCRYEMNAKGEN